MEDGFEQKFNYLIKAIKHEKFNVIALQEVNQDVNAPFVNYSKLRKLGFIKSSDKIDVKRGNFALLLVERLRDEGLYLNWAYCKNHIGYDKFDEGVALLTNYKVNSADEFFISKNSSYDNYRTRKAIRLNTEDQYGNNRDFISVHMGWWDDTSDPFFDQWRNLTENIYKAKNGDVYLMGDFNSPSNIRNQGYDLITSSGKWYDTYELAEIKDDGNTVVKKIDGWKDKDNVSAMRIDYVFKNNKEKVKSSNVIFNNKNYPIISDHYGIVVEE